MKFVILVLSALVVVASAQPLLPAAISTGTSSQFRSEDDFGNYNFGYDESHATGATSRREEQINGVRRGMYSLSDADGRRRVVNYVADAAGFRATIDTNEPGVEPKNPADVIINKASAPVVVAPLPVAPIVAAPSTASFATVAAPGPIAVASPRSFSYSFGTSHTTSAPLIATRFVF